MNDGLKLRCVVVEDGSVLEKTRYGKGMVIL